MQKQSYKKILAIMIAAFLCLSMLPIIAVQALAITAPAAGTHVTVGEKVEVKGTGASPGALVKLYWDQVLDTKKLNETYAKGDQTFSCNVKIPEDVVGDHWIIVSDVSVKVIVDPEVTLKPEIGLPDDTVTVNGTGFTAESVTTLKFWSAYGYVSISPSPSEIETSTKGSFSATFKVPTVDYGSYYVGATDAAAKSAQAAFKVGAAITLTPEEGSSGAQVGISGRGFQANGKANVTFDFILVLKNVAVGSDGKFSTTFSAPTVAALGDYTVTANDYVHPVATATFTITGLTKITLTPTSEAPGSSVTVEGINFTAVTNTEVTLDFGALTDQATFKTNSTGGFKGTFAVPSVAPSVTPYVVRCEDANGLYATAKFRVAVTTLATSPTKGPTGTKVLILGSGFTPSKAFNVTIAGELTVGGTGTLDTGGNIPSNFNVYLPTVSTGAKKIIVMDSEGVSKSVPFEVTKTTEIILTPGSAPVDYNVTIAANYFTAEAGKDLTVKLYNRTYTKIFSASEIHAASGFTSVKTNGTGSFLGWFYVPSLALGSYKINVTDANKLGVWEKAFGVVAATLEVTTSKATYLLGQDVTFKIKGSFASKGSIEITDPTTFKQTLNVVAGDYQKIGDWYYAYKTLTLRTDAPLGTWTWEATLDTKEVTGSFKISEVPTMEMLTEEITKLEESLTSLSDVVDELSGTVGATATDISAIDEAVSDLQAAVNALKTDISAAATSASQAKDTAGEAVTAAEAASTAASSASSAASEAADAAKAAQSTAAGISTAVYGAIVLSLIAAIASIVAVITLQRKVAG